MIEIVRGFISLEGADDLIRPIQQISYMGRTCQAEIIEPYGYHANLPLEASIVAFSVLGQSSNKMAIGSMPNRRETLETGEVMFYHPLHNSKIHFKNNGEIFVSTTDGNNVTDLTLFPTGEAILNSKLTVNGDIVFNGNIETNGNTIHNGEMDIQGNTSITGEYELSGNSTINGDIEQAGSNIITGDHQVTGNLTGGVVKTTIGINLATHTHNYLDNTGVPPVPIPAITDAANT